MKLRFSNGKNFAITFEANNVNDFFTQAVSALRSFRMQTERRVHQSEKHQTRSWFENPELHVYSETMNVWQDLSIIKQHNDMAYRQTFKIHFTNQTDSIEQIFETDRDLLDRNCAEFWRGCVDSNKWADNLNIQISNVGDIVRRKTEGG